MSTYSQNYEPLLKIELAERLREQIVSGALRPGVRIVEATWGKKFGAAQASIREAINLLVQEGFVSKAAGRSARVVSLSEEDVLQLYELRGAIEGLAARLAATRRSDTALLEDAVQKMRDAVVQNRRGALLDADLAFHLELCRLSGNPYVLEHARRILLPLFAFIRMRVTTSDQSTSPWDKNLEGHQRILDLVREGEGDVAEQYVRKVTARFAATAYDNWEKKPLPVKKKTKKHLKQ